MNPEKQTETPKDFQAFQQDLRALRDEVKLKLHLASMDLKTEWKELEPQLERALSTAGIISAEVVTDLKKRLAEFRQRLN